MASTAFSAPATLPPGRRVYAIGDVHGCLDKLVALHQRIARDLADRPVAHPVVIHLGDYIDRGPDSAGVIRHLLKGFAGAPTVNLLGNHEQMMLDAVEAGHPDALGHWMVNGGRAALHSWNVPVPSGPRPLADQIPAEHLRFLRGLSLAHRIGGYAFVHAGIRPGLPFERQSRHDLVWIREPFLSWPGDLGVVVVHGHTPTEAPVVKVNRIGVDTGAVLGHKLTCAVLEAEELRFLFA